MRPTHEIVPSEAAFNRQCHRHPPPYAEMATEAVRRTQVGVDGGGRLAEPGTDLLFGEPPPDPEDHLGLGMRQRQ